MFARIVHLFCYAILLNSPFQDIMTFTEYPAQDQEVLWEKRYDLTEIPGALPKVLLAAHSWDYACLPGLYGLIQQWKRPGKTTLEKILNKL